MLLVRLMVWWCVVIVLLVQNSNSLDVKCVQHSDNDCYITNIEHFQSDDQLNLVELENSNKIIEFTLSNSPAIKSFPNEIFDQLPSLNTVYITNTGIEMITTTFVENIRNDIRIFDITNSKLKLIPSNFLHSLPNVTRLDLTENQISTIQNAAFASSHLKELALNRNKLKVIKKDFFENTPNLWWIRLLDNLIEEIEDGAFNLPSLKELELDRNLLKTLPTNLFASTPRLESLYLQSNQLNDISALKNLQQIRHLNLNDNPTLKIVDVLWQLPNVRHLFLANTGITIDTVDGPLNSTTLRGLDISQNNLNDSRLLYHLSGLKNLWYIILIGNNLRKLDDFDKIEEYFPNLKHIWLTSNPWNCEWRKIASKICSEREGICIASFDLDPNAVCVEQLPFQ